MCVVALTGPKRCFLSVLLLDMNDEQRYQFLSVVSLQGEVVCSHGWHEWKRNGDWHMSALIIPHIIKRLLSRLYYFHGWHNNKELEVSSIWEREREILWIVLHCQRLKESSDDSYNFLTNFKISTWHQNKGF